MIVQLKTYPFKFEMTTVQQLFVDNNDSSSLLDCVQLFALNSFESLQYGLQFQVMKEIDW